MAGIAPVLGTTSNVASTGSKPVQGRAGTANRGNDTLNVRGCQEMRTILIVILILLLLGALPTWPYSAGWGYYPGGGLGVVLIIVVALILFGAI